MTILKALLTLLQLHWLDLLILIIFLGVLVWLWKCGKKATVIRIIRNLVTKAEEAYGSKTGAIKWNAVYTGLPWIIRVLWTQDELGEMIEDAVTWLKEKLAEREATLLKDSVTLPAETNITGTLPKENLMADDP